VLKDFVHVKELVINSGRLTKSLGALVAPYPRGLPSGLLSLTIVLREPFLRWIHKHYRHDYSFDQATPLLKHLIIGEVSSLDDRTASALQVDRSIGAPSFVQFMTGLPKNLETLILPPASHTLIPQMFPESLTRTSVTVRWLSNFDASLLPSKLVSLNVQVKDANALVNHTAKMFPKTLTDLTVMLKITEKTKLEEIPKPTWIKQLPPVSMLKLVNFDHLRFSDLPSVLTHFTYVSWYPTTGVFETDGWAPEYLTYLEIERWEPVANIGNLPKSLETLVLKTAKPTIISKLPENLTRLVAPAHTTFSSPHWPSTLHTLEIHHLTQVTPDTLASLPKTVTKLSMSIPSNGRLEDYFHELPTSIKHLSLWNRKADAGLFKSLKDSRLEVLELFGGDSANDFLPIEIARFKWSLLEHLPETIRVLRLPVVSEKFEPVLNLNRLSDLSIPNTVITFEGLQLSLVYYSQIRHILAKEYRIEALERDNANSVLASQPLLTLRCSVHSSDPKV
jgi:hypothetical protein